MLSRTSAASRATIPSTSFASKALVSCSTSSRSAGGWGSGEARAAGAAPPVPPGPASARSIIVGIGISMALPTVPTAVLRSVAPAELGTASGITNMLQRLGAVFAVAICSSVFAAYGGTATAATVTDGFRPALAVSIGLSLLGALSVLATGTARRGEAPAGRPVDATAAI
jgi:hypothetical protein